MTTDPATDPLYDDRHVHGRLGTAQDGRQEGTITALSAAAALREASTTTDVLFTALGVLGQEVGDTPVVGA